METCQHILHSFTSFVVTLVYIHGGGRMDENVAPAQCGTDIMKIGSIEGEF